MDGKKVGIVGTDVPTSEDVIVSNNNLGNSDNNWINDVKILWDSFKLNTKFILMFWENLLSSSQHLFDNLYSHNTTVNSLYT